MSESLDETLLNSESLYEGRVIRLLRETVRLPDGKVATREVIRHPGAVAIVPFDSEGNVILVRQYRLAPRRELIEIPAGTLEPGEDPIACAERELQEETGFKPGKLERLGGMFVAPGYSSEFIHLFIATELTESRLKADEDEFIATLHVTLTEALQMIAAGTIADGKSISGLLLAQTRHG